MKKIISIIIIAIIIFSMYILNVYAITSVSMRISPSKGEVKQGETISFTFSTADLVLEANDQGIQGIQGTLELNKNVFEDITLDNNFEGLNGWSVGAYNPNNGVVSITRSTFGTTAGNVFSISAKVKTNATLGNTQIKFKDVAVMPASLIGYKLASEVLTQVNITASAEATPTPTPTPTPTTNTPVFSTPTPTTSTNPITYPSPSPSTVPVTSPISSTTTKPTTNNTTNTEKKDSIPRTGKTDFIIPAIIIVAIFAIVTYTKYRKM